jgi:glucose/mannose-6-phosphate isomerase
VPTHRNLLHEFSHTEVATYSDPSCKQAIVVFRDSSADDYTRDKIRTLEELFGDKSIPQNRNIEFVTIDLDPENFFKKLFLGHFFTVYIAYYLGRYADVRGRDLISTAAKNPWWSQRSIELFPKCVDIPAVLEPQH